MVTHPNRPQGELEIALYPAKNDPVDIHVKVYVGPPGADLLQVCDNHATYLMRVRFLILFQHSIGFRDNAAVAKILYVRSHPKTDSRRIIE